MIHLEIFELTFMYDVKYRSSFLSFFFFNVGCPIVLAPFVERSVLQIARQKDTDVFAPLLCVQNRIDSPA